MRLADPHEHQRGRRRDLADLADVARSGTGHYNDLRRDAELPDEGHHAVAHLIKLFAGLRKMAKAQLRRSSGWMFEMADEPGQRKHERGVAALPAPPYIDHRNPIPGREKRSIDLLHHNDVAPPARQEKKHLRKILVCHVPQQNRVRLKRSIAVRLDKLAHANLGAFARMDPYLRVYPPFFEPASHCRRNLLAALGGPG